MKPALLGPVLLGMLIVGGSLASGPPSVAVAAPIITGVETLAPGLANIPGVVSGDGRWSFTHTIVGGVLSPRGFVAGSTAPIDGIANGSAGAAPNAETRLVATSHTGRFAVLASQASNLGATETTFAWRTYLVDRDTDANGTFDEVDGRSIERLGADTGFEGGVPVADAAISSDGRYVTYPVPSMAGGSCQQLVRLDRTTNTTVSVSTDPSGQPGSVGGVCASFQGIGTQSISDDGNIVAFTSGYSNLVADDSNPSEDVFVRNISQAATTRLNGTADGSQSTLGSLLIGMSTDGQRVVTARRLTTSANAIFALVETQRSSGVVTGVGAVAQRSDPTLIPAAISGDGGTIVWAENGAGMIMARTAGAAPIVIGGNGGSAAAFALGSQPGTMLTQFYTPPTGGAGAIHQILRGTLIDMPELGLAVTAPVGEGLDNDGVRFTTSGPVAAAVTVDYSIVSASTPPSADATDLSFASGSVVIPAGQSSSPSLTLEVVEDLLVEQTERFEIRIDAISGPAATPTSAYTVDLIDNDFAPSVSVADAVMWEGDTTVRALSFAVSLSSPSATDIVLSATSVAETATLNDDFSRYSAARIRIPAGATRVIAIMRVLPDLIDEVDETVRLEVTLFSGAANIVDGVGVGTIIDNDPTPTISLLDAIVAEGARFVEVQLVMSGPTGERVTLHISTAAGTATPVLDYTANSWTLYLGSSNTTRVLRIPIRNDRLHEPNEQFVVNIDSASNAVISRGQATITIVDND